VGLRVAEGGFCSGLPLGKEKWNREACVSGLPALDRFWEVLGALQQVQGGAYPAPAFRASSLAGPASLERCWPSRVLSPVTDD